MIPWFEPLIVDFGIVRVHSFTLIMLACLTVAPLVGLIHAWLGGGRAWPLLVLPIGVLGFAWPVGRAVEVLTRSPWMFLEDPAMVIKLHYGTSFPGFVAGLIPVCVFIAVAGRKWATVDGLAVTLAVSASFVYFGRFLVHDYPGRMTKLPVGVRGICVGQWGNYERACHDLGLYTSLGFAVFVALAFLLLVTHARGWTAGVFALWAGAQHVGIPIALGGAGNYQPWLALPLVGLGLALFGLRLLVRGTPPDLEREVADP